MGESEQAIDVMYCNCTPLHNDDNNNNNNTMQLETLFIVQLYHSVHILLLPRSLDSISIPH